MRIPDSFHGGTETRPGNAIENAGRVTRVVRPLLNKRDPSSYELGSLFVSLDWRVLPVQRLTASVQIDHITFDIDDVGLKHLRLSVTDHAIHHLRSVTCLLAH